MPEQDEPFVLSVEECKDWVLNDEFRKFLKKIFYYMFYDFLNIMVFVFVSTD